MMLYLGRNRCENVIWKQALEYVENNIYFPKF